METKTPAARYSTQEIAARLFLSLQETRAVLKAGKVRFTKAGSCQLWDGKQVEDLISRLCGVGEGASMKGDVVMSQQDWSSGPAQKAQEALTYLDAALDRHKASLKRKSDFEGDAVQLRKRAEELASQERRDRARCALEGKKYDSTGECEEAYRKATEIEATLPMLSDVLRTSAAEDVKTATRMAEGVYGCAEKALQQRSQLVIEELKKGLCALLPLYGHTRVREGLNGYGLLGELVRWPEGGHSLFGHLQDLRKSIDEGSGNPQQSLEHLRRRIASVLQWFQEGGNNG